MSATTDSNSASASPQRDLTPLFCPRSIAVVGASRKTGSVGHAVIRNLIYGRYEGVIYPVNPKAKGIQGIPCFPDLGSLPDTPETREDMARCKASGYTPYGRRWSSKSTRWYY